MLPPALRSARWTAALVAIAAVAFAVLVALTTTWLIADDGGSAGPFGATLALDEDLQADLVVDPNRAGRNTLHVYVLDSTGQPAGDVEDLRFELSHASQDTGPITVEPLFAGPGHWIATVEDLRVAGDWSVRLLAMRGPSTELTATVTVTVAP